MVISKNWKVKGWLHEFIYPSQPCLTCVKTQWGLEINYILLRFEYEVTPPSSAAVPDVLELQYKLSWPGPQQSGRSWHIGGFPEARRCQGSSVTCLELAALTGDTWCVSCEVARATVATSCLQKAAQAVQATRSTVGKWSVACQAGPDDAVGTAVCAGGHTGRALSPYQLKKQVQLVVITLLEGA